MKKIQKLSMIALAISTVACAQIEDPAAPQTPEAPADENSIVFTANVPTRTAIADDDKTVTWVAGDQVKFVWDGGETVATAAGSGASTTFTIRVDESVEEVYAVYPADVCGGFSEGEVTLNFSNQLTGGEFSKADICVAKSVKNNGSWNTTLNFKNAACLLKVGVTTDDITRVQVQSVGEEIISGSLPVSIDADGELVFGEVAGEKKNTVNMEVSGAGNYYVSVLPDVEMASGFRVNCFKGDEALTPFYYNGAFTTERGQIIKLSEIESRLGQYYVTPEGSNTKTGQSWSNAMDVETFKTFVTNQDNHFLLKGATFHFSADDFSFGDDYLILNYPDHSNVAFTLEGTVTQTDTTVFLGRTNTSEDNKAGVLWPQNNTYLTVRNVKFTGTNGESNSAAIRINSGAKELTLDNCYFVGNQTNGGGASIGLYNSCTLTVRNSSFSGNTGNGAALIVSNEAATVIMEDCKIKANNHQAIRSENVNTMTLTRVLFEDNNGTGEYSGSAARFQGAGTVTLTDCEFIDNHADCGGGAVYIPSGAVHVTFNGGKFEGNYSTGSDDKDSAGAAIYAEGSGVAFDCNNVLFKDNYNNVGTSNVAGGIIRVQQDNGVARFNGCTFDGNYSYRTSSTNYPCPAIIAGRTKAKFFFNACEFKNNSSGRANSGSHFGGRNGSLIYMYGSGTVGMNNCSIHDNYNARSLSANLDWIHMGGNGDYTFILANSTIIGDQVQYGGTLKNKNGVIYLEKDGYNRWFNNIICSNYSDGASVRSGSTDYIGQDKYNKTSPGTDSDTNWGTANGSGHDYWASNIYFGDWSAPYTWNGNLLAGTNNTSLATTADVNAWIRDAVASTDFYNWLDSIGALGKDINGNDRGTTSWPGCYQAN